MFGGAKRLPKALDMLAVGANAITYDAVQQRDVLGMARESHVYVYSCRTREHHETALKQRCDVLLG